MLSIPRQSVHDKSEEYKATQDILSATWAWSLPFFSDESVGTLKSSEWDQGTRNSKPELNFDTYCCRQVVPQS